MSKINQQPVPAMLQPIFKHLGIKIKKYRSAAAFEKDLEKFLKRNHVLHLSTCRNNMPRCTPIEYRLHGLTFYLLSEGGGKFRNLKENRKIAFSIAEPYNSDEDFFNSKGVQAWGTARVYNSKESPKKFQEALKKMNIMKALKRTGQKQLPADFNYRIIEIIPDRIKYSNKTEGVYKVTWQRR